MTDSSLAHSQTCVMLQLAGMCPDDRADWPIFQTCGQGNASSNDCATQSNLYNALSNTTIGGTTIEAWNTTSAWNARASQELSLLADLMTQEMIAHGDSNTTDCNTTIQQKFFCGEGGSNKGAAISAANSCVQEAAASSAAATTATGDDEDVDDSGYGAATSTANVKGGAEKEEEQISGASASGSLEATASTWITATESAASASVAVGWDEKLPKAAVKKAALPATSAAAQNSLGLSNNSASGNVTETTTITFTSTSTSTSIATITGNNSAPGNASHQVTTLTSARTSTSFETLSPVGALATPVANFLQEASGGSVFLPASSIAASVPHPATPAKLKVAVLLACPHPRPSPIHLQ